MNGIIETEGNKEFLMARIQCVIDILTFQQLVISELKEGYENCCGG